MILTPHYRGGMFSYPKDLIDENLAELKEKSKGRNKDLHISEMTNYQSMKEQIVKHKKELDRFSKKTEYIINETKNINDLFDNLKPIIVKKEEAVSAILFTASAIILTL